jgi:tetratricopeptide (TPR) repeat protein
MLCIVFLKANAQERDLIFRIQNCLEQKDIKCAVSSSDSAVLSISHKDNARAWYLRGYAYKEYYKKYDAESHATQKRIQSYQSFVRSIQLDKANELLIENQKNLKSLAILYFNDVKAFIDSLNTESAEKYFDFYKKTMTAADSSFDFSKKEIDVNLALGYAYLRLAETADSLKRKGFIEKEKQSFTKVLQIEPNNITANYNMALLYYNQAVKIINAMGYDEDIMSLNLILDNCTGLFKESLPYMEKAYRLNPNRRETLIGLSGIYFSLNEEEKRQYIDNMLQDLDRNKK